MSIFKPATAACPKCHAAVRFPMVASVNADRRPELRQEILAGTFQSLTCPTCSCRFRAPPRLTYIDVARQQWILVLPANRLEAWPALEWMATETFTQAYGPDAPAPAQEIGRTLQARIAFGWAALSEKILCVEHGLDDVTLELLKLALLRGVEEPPLSDVNEMRLQHVDGNTLDLAWIVAATETRLKSLAVPKSLYDEIVDAPEAWQPLRDTLSASPFADYTRLLVPAG